MGLGLISQFFADIIFTIATDNIITSDIIISDIALYYGAASAGLIAAFLSPKLDKLSLITISAITFAYVNNLIDSIGCSYIDDIKNYNDEKGLKEFYNYCNETIKNYNNII